MSGEAYGLKGWVNRRGASTDASPERGGSSAQMLKENDIVSAGYHILENVSGERERRATRRRHGLVLSSMAVGWTARSFKCGPALLSQGAGVTRNKAQDHAHGKFAA